MDSLFMALSTSVQGHQVEVLLSLINPLSIESHYFFAIFTLAKIKEIHVRERTTVQKYRDMVITHQSICGRL
jgi:hypothetical protein